MKTETDLWNSQVAMTVGKNVGVRLPEITLRSMTGRSTMTQPATSAVVRLPNGNIASISSVSNVNRDKMEHRRQRDVNVTKLVSRRQRLRNETSGKRCGSPEWPESVLFPSRSRCGAVSWVSVLCCVKLVVCKTVIWSVLVSEVFCVSE